MSYVTADTELQPAMAIPREHSRMSWGAVFAGTFVAVAMSFLFGILGLALGIGGLHMSRDVAQGVDTITAGAGTGGWLVLGTLLSMALGGYVAGRLAGTFSHLDAELHGLTVWALTALASAALLGQLVNAALSEATQLARPTSALTGGVTTGDTGFGAMQGMPSLSELLQQSLSTGGDPARMTRNQLTTEINLLIDRRLTNGSLAAAERDRLLALIMQRDGVSRDEATLRISRMEQEASGFLSRSRVSASNTIDLAARAVTASLLLGLMAALLGAWFGTRHVRRIAVQVPVATVPRTVYEPPIFHSVVDDAAPRRAVFDVTGLTLPATKADLLRQARAAAVEPGLLAALERAADRRYVNMEDLLAELRVSA